MILVGLHLGFHLVELLILPSVLLVFGSHAIEEPAMATTHEAEYLELIIPPKNTSAEDTDSTGRCAHDMLTSENLSIQRYLGLDTTLCVPIH